MSETVNMNVCEEEREKNGFVLDKGESEVLGKHFGTALLQWGSSVYLGQDIFYFYMWHVHHEYLPNMNSATITVKGQD